MAIPVPTADLYPVLITGAGGFIGRHLASVLGKSGQVRVLSRGGAWVGGETTNLQVVIGDLSDPDSIRGVCDGMKTVFHLAGYAHSDQLIDEQGNDLHWLTTVKGTEHLLGEATAADVERMVFISSIKAMGESTGTGCVDESLPAKPLGAYGVAKREAEIRVLNWGAAAASRQAAVLRIPLVYGVGQKGNLTRMIRAIDRGRFPRLPVIDNRRSMIHVDDVVQALLLLAQNRRASGRVYLATDGRTYSTDQIYLAICAALGRRPSRWALPMWLLRAVARFGDSFRKTTGKSLGLDSNGLDKLLGSACYSCEAIVRDLGYVPQFDLGGALPEIVTAWRANEDHR